MHTRNDSAFSTFRKSHIITTSMFYVLFATLIHIPCGCFVSLSFVSTLALSLLLCFRVSLSWVTLQFSVWDLHTSPMNYLRTCCWQLLACCADCYCFVLWLCNRCSCDSESIHGSGFSAFAVAYRWNISIYEYMYTYIYTYIMQVMKLQIVKVLDSNIHKVNGVRF